MRAAARAELGMSKLDRKRPNAVYQNPVYPKSFPDPFILKFGRHYFGYCTGLSSSGSVFDVIRSQNLTDWERIGAAMEPIAALPPFYWAPEVSYGNGQFYLYYSCGNETLMEIRVAVSDRPDGGFVDSGRRLTHEEFAIDAHVFVDDDGQKYLFYATDFLGYTHIGTGTVVDRMLDWFQLEGKPQPVTRAAFDWQVYDPHRVEKGGVRWHTVEGPTVFKHKKTYFQMFSGGNWQNSSYGVGFATSNAVQNSAEWLQSIDGETVFPILRTIPEKVIGPGHNSAVIGPNGRERFCVYHSWVGDERVMSVDRMDFVADRLFVNGPTYERQPAPLAPSSTFASIVETAAANGWQFDGDSLTSPSEGKTSLPIGRHKGFFLFQFTAKLATAADSSGEVAIRFQNDDTAFALRIAMPERRISISNGSNERELSVPNDLDFREFQTFAFEINGETLDFSINGMRLTDGVEIAGGAGEIFVETANIACEINDLVLTEGFVDLFDRTSTPSWERISGEAGVDVVDEELRISNPDQPAAIVAKGVTYQDFEFAANIRCVESAGSENSFGFALLDEGDEVKGRFEVGNLADKFYISYDREESDGFLLPSNYSTEKYRQFRFVRQGGVLRLESEDRFLGEVNVGTFPAKIGIICKGARLGLDMVRSIKI